MSNHHPPSSSTSSSNSRDVSAPASATAGSGSSHNNSSGSGNTAVPQPYHITHGATTYQQMTRRSKKEPLLFSASGFDIISILTRVASRPNPTVFIGPVDFSCAFLVADATVPDCPILYASPPLAKMTGYEVSDFLGHACRFLQWPNGGRAPRESHPSNAQARAEIKHAIATDTECQTTLVNYRKNGDMFLNFVTIVPISWDNPDEVRFWVGFQVDISEPAGLYSNSLPMKNINVIPISPEAPISNRLKALVGPLESSDTQREGVYKFLLDNVDDFIMAVSSDGIIHHVTDRVSTSLGWAPSDLISQSISHFIHPADVDTVLNELASFRFIPPPPRTSSSVDIAAHYSRQNRVVHLMYRACVKTPSSTAPANSTITEPESVTQRRKRSRRQRRAPSHPYADVRVSSGNAAAPPPGRHTSAPHHHLPSSLNPISESTSSAIPSDNSANNQPEYEYEWVESSGRIHIESPGRAIIILSTRVVHLPPRLTYEQVDSADGFTTNHAESPRGSNGLGSCWARVALDSGVILSVTGSPFPPESGSGSGKEINDRRNPNHDPGSSTGSSSHPHSSSSKSNSNPPSPPIPNPPPSYSYIRDLLNTSPSNLVGTRLQDWLSYEFVPTIDTVFSDVRKGAVKPFSNWSKPREVTAMIIPSSSGSTRARSEEKTRENGAAFGKPVIITFFPPEPLPLPAPSSSVIGIGPVYDEFGMTTASTSAGGTDVPMPVYTSYDAQGEPLGYPYPHMHMLSNPSDGGVNPGLLGANDSDQAPLLPESMFIRLSSPLQSLPQGMLSATGAPQTNQAYLYNPFAALRPAVTSGSGSGAGSGLANNSNRPANGDASVASGSGSNARQSTVPGIPHTHNHPSTSSRNPNINTHSANIPPQLPPNRLDDIFESLWPTPSSASSRLTNPNSSVAPSGNPRWEDQLNMLRAQNARMQREIDEIIAQRTQQAQHGNGNGNGNSSGNPLYGQGHQQQQA